MQPARPLTQLLELPNGGSVELDDGYAILRNAQHEVLLRFDGHTVELMAAGDLTLAAPNGAVRIQARDEVLIEGREIRQRARQQASLEVAETQLCLNDRSLTARSERLSCRAEDAELHTERANLLAGRIATTAQQLVQEVERVELRAGKIVEHAGDVLRHASGLLQQRAGRMRVLVERGYYLLAERTDLRSSEETSIDGKKILLG